jgi:formate dehydrogenase (coenzyme F420) beta subunit
MSRYTALPVEDAKINDALAAFVATLLEKKVVSAVMVPARQAHGPAVFQTLISDPAEAQNVDPLAPVATVSSATELARLTRKNTGGKLAAFLRPCEMRAYLELVKLNQATLENLLLIGMDCYGRYENVEYVGTVATKENGTLEFLKAQGEGVEIIDSCISCVNPTAENVDLHLQVFGHDPEKALGIEAISENGEKAFEALGYENADVPANRTEAVAALTEKRKKARGKQHAELQERVGSLKGLMEVLTNCVNCYNCRNACPVCYCRECVFTTDTFLHDSQQFFSWSAKHGSLRMPTDTLMYHLTRFAHISTLCVGCGQCSSACPNDIPVAEIVQLVGEGTQAVFGYEPGHSVSEAQPLATFVENELIHVTGQVK